MKKQAVVVQVLPSLQSGGVERGTLEIARYLVQQGYRSIVLSAGGRLVDTLEAQGSEHITIDIGKKSLLTLRHIPFLRRFLRTEQVDILHLRSRMPAWVCYLAWRSMPPAHRPRLVTTVHGLYSINRYSRIMTKGERVIAVSETVQSYIEQHYKTEKEKIALIYRGVDRAHYPFHYQPNTIWLNQWHQTYPALRNKKLLVLSGRISRLKGHTDLIKVMSKLSSLPSVHALIVGEVKKGKESYQQELVQLAKSLGVESTITFLGHRQDMREIMSIAKIVLSLSYTPESFGRVSIEALSLGVPVIGYDHGGVGEQLKMLLPEGKVAVGDIDALAERIQHWLQQPPIIQREHPFLLSEMVQQTVSVYEALLDESSPEYSL